ncbi:hypothetical protein IMSAGC019_00823 [Lachnospiraceae bacterium]|nr:hypothetical protein IMSAGC019_00823 [Lachnospiraceae bacterium]
MMDKKRDIINKIAYGSFYGGIVIEALLVIIDKSAYTNPIEGQIFRLTFLLFLVKACFTRYSAREYALILFLGAVGALSYFATGRNEALRLVVLVAACKNVDMKKCLKLVFFLTLAGCAVIILLSLSGVYGAAVLTQDYGRGSVESRYTLGMGHPNALHCMVWSLILLGLYLYGEKMKWYYFAAPLILNYVFFLLTDSKTSFLVTGLTIVLTMLLVLVQSERFKRLCVAAGYLGVIFCVGISVTIAANAYRVYDYVWNGDRSEITLLFVKLNEIFNGRIRILVENDGFEGTVGTWSLFSRPENNYFFDMGWIRLFYWFGIIPAGVFLGALLLLMVYCYKKQDYMAAVVIISISVYSVIEAHVFSDYLARNYIFFLLGAYWHQMFPIIRRDKEKGKK